MTRLPRVAVVMGSDSDLETMQETIDVLGRFGLEAEVRVLSAHRTPTAAAEFAAGAEAAGFGVIVAAAGGAAHLAGVLASHTVLPVIGVPMATPSLGGVDSLYSIVQMPAGVPVATVAIGRPGAHNAAILAAQILSVGHPELRRKLHEYKQDLAARVAAKDQAVRSRFTPAP